MDENEYIFRFNKALRQNGFDITSDGPVKYTIKKTPPKKSKKPSSSKLPYVAIGVIAIIAIVAIVAIFLSPSGLSLQSDSGTKLQITDAYVDDEGWCFIWGAFDPVPKKY